MSLETMTKLGTVTVGVGGASVITFSNIPQTYTDLVVKVSMRSTAAYLSVVTIFNDDQNLYNYNYRSIYGNGTSAVTDNQNAWWWVTGNPSNATASVFSNGEMTIPGYTRSNYKSVFSNSVSENNATYAIANLVAGTWPFTAPINRVDFYAYLGTFAQYSTATLYGVKAMRTAVGNSIKATGGAISFDGTYVTHTFNTTSTFTPTTNLTADYLVVAGGGGGGRTGGGGGAGGFRTSIGGSSLFLTTTSYTVTVGAGGAGTNTDGATGSSGSDSVFSTITSSGGGGGGSIGINGAAGGSGGGGGTNDSGTPYYTGGAGNTPSTSPSQGNTGGIGNGGYPNRAGGGGGGAGAVGGAATGAASGDGGNGTASSITGSSVTYAGGGGGVNAANGGTGGGGKTTVNSGAGTANTGGGGAGRDASTGGTGGSGIVIVRYKA